MEHSERIRTLMGQLASASVTEIERLDVEIKKLEPLQRRSDYSAQIAKAVMALSNHDGGFLIVGFELSDYGYQEDVDNPSDIETWEKTRLHDMLGQYMSPVVEVDLSIETGDSSRHPVLVVPPHGATPIVCTRDSNATRKGAVYIRKPGPKSEEPSTPEEWAPLIRRCVLYDKEGLASTFRHILEPPDVIASPEPAADILQEAIAEADQRFEELKAQSDSPVTQMALGRWTIAYQMVPLPSPVSLTQLLENVRSAELSVTGWPIGVVMERDELRPHPWGKTLEAWMVSWLNDGLDYWLARPTGFFYATRALKEDFMEQGDQSVLEWFNPIWRMGEAILHSVRLAKSFQQPIDHLRFFARYQGLKDRILWNNNPSIAGLPDIFTCRTDEWSNEIVIPSNLPTENLPDVTMALLAPFYEQFDLFVMPAELYGREITRMLGYSR